MNQKVKIISVLLATLILGGLLGALINGALMKKSFRKHRDPQGVFQRMIDRLDLEPTQRDSVLSIFEKHHADIRQIRTQFKSDMFASRDSLMNELKPILSPEQISKLEKLVKRHGKRRHGPRKHDRIK